MKNKAVELNYQSQPLSKERHPMNLFSQHQNLLLDRMDSNGPLLGRKNLKLRKFNYGSVLNGCSGDPKLYFPYSDVMSEKEALCQRINQIKLSNQTSKIPKNSKLNLKNEANLDIFKMKGRDFNSPILNNNLKSRNFMNSGNRSDGKRNDQNFTSTNSYFNQDTPLFRHVNSFNQDLNQKSAEIMYNHTGNSNENLSIFEMEGISTKANTMSLKPTKLAFTQENPILDLNLTESTNVKGLANDFNSSFKNKKCILSLKPQICDNEEATDADLYKLSDSSATRELNYLTESKTSDNTTPKLKQQKYDKNSASFTFQKSSLDKPSFSNHNLCKNGNEKENTNIIINNGNLNVLVQDFEQLHINPLKKSRKLKVSRNTGNKVANIEKVLKNLKKTQRKKRKILDEERHTRKDPSFIELFRQLGADTHFETNCDNTRTQKYCKGENIRSSHSMKPSLDNPYHYLSYNSNFTQNINPELSSDYSSLSFLQLDHNDSYLNRNSHTSGNDRKFRNHKLNYSHNFPTYNQNNSNISSNSFILNDSSRTNSILSIHEKNKSRNLTEDREINRPKTENISEFYKKCPINVVTLPKHSKESREDYRRTHSNSLYYKPNNPSSSTNRTNSNPSNYILPIMNPSQIPSKHPNYTRNDFRKTSAGFRKRVDQINRDQATVERRIEKLNAIHKEMQRQAGEKEELFSGSSNLHKQEIKSSCNNKYKENMKRSNNSFLIDSDLDLKNTVYRIDVSNSSLKYSEELKNFPPIEESKLQSSFHKIGLTPPHTENPQTTNTTQHLQLPIQNTHNSQNTQNTQNSQNSNSSTSSPASSSFSHKHNTNTNTNNNHISTNNNNNIRGLNKNHMDYSENGDARNGRIQVQSYTQCFSKSPVKRYFIKRTNPNQKSQCPPSYYHSNNASNQNLLFNSKRSVSCAFNSHDSSRRNNQFGKNNLCNPDICNLKRQKYDAQYSAYLNKCNIVNSIKEFFKHTAKQLPSHKQALLLNLIQKMDNEIEQMEDNES